MSIVRFLSIGILYLVAVFFSAPLFFLSVAVYGLYFKSQAAPLIIALLIDVQFAAVAGFVPWYLIGTAVTLISVYFLRPYIRFVPQS